MVILGSTPLNYPIITDKLKLKVCSVEMFVKLQFLMNVQF